MAGDWIKIETSLPHKPEVMQLADILDIDELQVVGHLVLFWSWCDGQMSVDCPQVKGTKRGLDRAACRTGFADAMVEVGWLEINGSEFTIPHLDYHLSKTAKKRAKDAKDKQRQRTFVRTGSGQMSAPNTDKTRTENRPEKRREEKRIIEPPIYTSPPPESDVMIPHSVDTPEIRKAFNRWVNHINADDTHKSIVPNSPQEESTWRFIAGWQLPEAETIAAIDAAIAGQWSNLRKPEAPRAERQNGKPQGKGVMDHLDDMIKEEKRSEKF